MPITEIKAVPMAKTVRPAGHRRLRTFNYDGVRLLPGPFQRQFAEAERVYEGLADDALLYGFRQRAGLSPSGESLGGWYGNDIFNAFGQFVGGMARMAKADPESGLRAKVDRLIGEWGKAIGQDGYFFYSRKPNAYHYFYEKMMGGLNDAYEYLGNEQAPVLASRITDWAITHLDRRRTPASSRNPVGGDGIGDNEWYTLAENLYRAYELTGDAKYAAFARTWHYDSYWDGYIEGRPAVDGLHAYSHVNTLSSAAMAYGVTGDAKYLRCIVNAYDFLQDTQCFATGGYGPGERLEDPGGGLGEALEDQMRTFETPCGSWAGFKLSKYLMEFTGESRYGDWIERLMYNGIGAALPVRSNGDTFYYADYRKSGGLKFYHWKQWPCCSGTYPQAVADYHDIIYFHDNEGLFVNLYLPSQVTWRRDDTPDGIVRLRQETNYPDDGVVSFTLEIAHGASFPLSFRIPAWAGNDVSIKVNGVDADVAVVPGAWATIRRGWSSGDRIQLLIPPRLRLAPIDHQHPDRVAVVQGPAVLVASGGRGPSRQLLTQWRGTPGSTLPPSAVNAIHRQFVRFQAIDAGLPYLMYFDLPA